MQAQREAPLDLQCKDKFLIQGVATSSTTTLNDITPELVHLFLFLLAIE